MVKTTIADGAGKIVWVGTGEGNGRNSSSWGNGVYRSTDAGATFTHLGLENTHDIPAIAVHPADPETCYVAALGHLWGANPERGVYRTTDGGESWDHVLAIDENTGACDVVIDPNDPDTLLAAMYMRRRTGYSYQSGGPEGGIYRSTDAGDTWTRITDGLPDQTGRIGLSFHAADSDIVYATIESDMGGNVGDPWTNRSRAGGVFRSDDNGKSWTRTSDFAPRSFYFSRIRVDPADPDRVYNLGWQVLTSDDGGRTFYNGLASVPHVDFHAMVIDPEDTDHLLIGNDGGIYESHDRGATWKFHDTMAVGQFYNIAVDDSDPYRVGGGLQDNGSWVGYAETRHQSDGSFMGRGGGITNADWRFVNWGDGFHLDFDPTDANIIYAESQGGWINPRPPRHRRTPPHPPGREGRPAALPLQLERALLRLATRSDRPLPRRQPRLQAHPKGRCLDHHQPRPFTRRSQDGRHRRLIRRDMGHRRLPHRVTPRAGPHLGRYRRWLDTCLIR